jgi:hypothetical protein
MHEFHKAAIQADIINRGVVQKERVGVIGGGFVRFEWDVANKVAASQLAAEPDAELLQKGEPESERVAAGASICGEGASLAEFG